MINDKMQELGYQYRLYYLEDKNKSKDYLIVKEIYENPVLESIISIECLNYIEEKPSGVERICIPGHFYKVSLDYQDQSSTSRYLPYFTAMNLALDIARQVDKLPKKRNI